MAITEFQVSQWVKKCTYFNLRIRVESHLKRHDAGGLGGEQLTSQKMVLRREDRVTSSKGVPGDTGSGGDN